MLWRGIGSSPASPCAFSLSEAPITVKRLIAAAIPRCVRQRSSFVDFPAFLVASHGFPLPTTDRFWDEPSREKVLALRCPRPVRRLAQIWRQRRVLSCTRHCWSQARAAHDKNLRVWGRLGVKESCARVFPQGARVGRRGGRHGQTNDRPASVRASCLDSAMTVKTLIIDDEPLARDRLRQLLAEESAVEESLASAQTVSKRWP